mmetsp:Transcript_6742/g.14735  ORF Transcript_6742/g.14735 Transcript_6742/m.14735 type:complete len:91 (-) Transcript_6742:194-466(-)
MRAPSSATAPASSHASSPSPSVSPSATVPSSSLNFFARALSTQEWDQQGECTLWLGTANAAESSVRSGGKDCDGSGGFSIEFGCINWCEV